MLLALWRFWSCFCSYQLCSLRCEWVGDPIPLSYFVRKLL
uniref:Uncharacterized protein n=1 Tax=Arundo donax TaxID=35708 RepID=A0A0A8ZUS7_ARUDO